MRYGFVIDQNRCIGCHACTVACKEEHNIAVGVFRTWVKYVERGTFPQVQRHFGVLRCNHCDLAPCVEICPTSALNRRLDGIVDFDNRRCIGCKSCMQACPYDALYIDPNTNTAAKCNFCVHRVESRMEPACVIVCPVQAIIAGDLDDRTSSISRIVASEKVIARKPHKGTSPKLFYVGIDEALLEPASVQSDGGGLAVESRGTALAAIEPRSPQTDSSGPTDSAGTPLDLGREVYNVAHPAPWGWQVAGYLWTKSVAAGVSMVVALLAVLGWPAADRFSNIAAPSIALAFIGLTGILLVGDLKRPDRFYFLFTKPNLRSWLVRGSYIIVAYSGAVTLWLVAGVFLGATPRPLLWACGALGVATAGYTAFLFAQAKGRDFWQSPLLLWHLLVQAALGGSAILVIAGALGGAASPTIRELDQFLLVAVAVAGAMTVGELWGVHESEDARLAWKTLAYGTMRGRFWFGFMGNGVVVPVVLLAWALSAGPLFGLSIAAGATALMGLLLYEDIWRRAGQAVPLS